MTLTGGANRWTNWVKEFASKNNLSYGCALSTPECKEQYRAKYGNRKKLSQKQEKEMMMGEDKDAPNIQLTIAEEPKKKGRPKKYATEAEAKRAKSINTMEAKKRRQAEKKALKEAEKMGAEDFDVKPIKKKNPELEMMGMEDKDAPSKEKYLSIIRKNIKKIKAGKTVPKEIIEQIKVAYDANAMTEKEMEEALTLVGLWNAELRKRKAEIKAMGEEDKDVPKTAVDKKLEKELEQMGAEDKDTNYIKFIKMVADQFEAGENIKPQLTALNATYTEGLLDAKEQKAFAELVEKYNEKKRKEKAQKKEGKGYEGGRIVCYDDGKPITTTIQKQKALAVAPPPPPPSSPYLSVIVLLNERLDAGADIKGELQELNIAYSNSLLDDKEEDALRALVDKYNVLKKAQRRAKKGKGYDSDEEEMIGGHWTLGEVGHLEKELKNYENIAHHLGQHLSEKGAQDPKDKIGFVHFSREADRIRELISSINDE
jgi:hypothetical protein